MEGMQHQYKYMNFQEASAFLIGNSHNMSSLQQCQSFVDTRFVRHKYVENMDEYNSNDQKQSIKLSKNRVIKITPSNINQEK